MIITWRSKKDGVIRKDHSKDWETFIEAAHYAEDFGEDSIIEVLIIKQ